MPPTLDICSWNCKGFRARNEDLRLLLNETKPQVILLQETHLPSTHRLTIPGYFTYRQDPMDGNRQGGLAVCAKTDLPHYKINLTTNLHVLAVRVGAEYPITLCNIYLDCNTNITAGQINHIIQQLPQPFILMGDWNAHSLAWGASKVDSRGTLIENIIDQNNLYLYNQFEKTYVDARTGKMDALDLAIGSANLAQSSKFRTSPHLYGSDHFPIFISLFPTNQNGPTTTRWSFKNADWDNYRRSLDQTPSFRLVRPDNHAEELLHYITMSILTAAQNSIPYVTCGRGRPLVPWWNQDCKRILKERRKAWRTFRKNPSQENLISYRKARAKSRYVFKKSKRDSWIKYISSINQFTPSSDIWKKVKMLSGKIIEKKLPVIKQGSELVSNPQTVADILATHFATVSATSSYSPSFQKIKTEKENFVLKFTSDNTADYNALFVLWELETALKSLKPTSPGPDQIHNLMLKHMTLPFQNYCLKLFNLIWTTQSYPESWGLATLVPVPKPGKDPMLPSNHPIAMTNTLAKLCEKIVNSRLMWILEQKGCLSPCQSGFRKNRSTTDNLVSLEAFVTDGFLRRKDTVGVFFDCEKAYDKVWRYEVLKQLYEIGLRGNLPVFINNFLTNRRFKVRVGNDYSSIHHQENGVPQGAVLSVTLFLLAVNKVKEIMPPSIKTLAFVDDITILFQTKHFSQTYNVLQQSIDSLNQWATKTGLSFSPSKSNYIIFSRKHKTQPFPHLKLSGKNLPQVDEIKYLGLILDRKLSWKPHINHLRAKCFQDLNLLRAIQANKWGADRMTLLRIYRQLIRSKLDYGSTVYGSAKDNCLSKLDPIHNSGLRLATGAFKTSPVHSLLVESNEPALTRRRDILLLRYGLRIMQNPNNPVYKIFKSQKERDLYDHQTVILRPAYIRFRDLLNHYELLDLPQPAHLPHLKTPPWIYLRSNQYHLNRKTPKSQTLPEEYIQGYLKFKALHHNWVHIFTDASKNLQGGGCAFLAGPFTKQFTCDKWSSITTLELTAILQALQYIASNKIDNAVIYTDSLSSIHALDALYSRPPTVNDILDCLFKYSLKVKFCWIPGHSGIADNEAVDKLAKDAITQGEQISTVVTPKDLFNFTSRSITQKWQYEWRENSNNKLQAIKPNLADWGTSNRPNRHEEVVLCRLRIGHSRVTHSYLFSRDKDPPTCRLCNDILTVKHFLCDCIRLEDIRKKYDLPITIMSTLQDDEQTIKRLFLYLKDIDLISEI